MAPSQVPAASLESPVNFYQLLTLAGSTLALPPKVARIRQEQLPAMRTFSSGYR
jgi:hypothetical protein